MMLPNFIDLFVEFGMVLANVIVCVFTAAAYRQTRKCSLLLIAISSGIGVVLTLAPWMRENKPSWLFWGFYKVATIVDLSFWVVGIRLLVKEYAELVPRITQPEAPPDGGPSPLSDNPGSGGAPPVS